MKDKKLEGNKKLIILGTAPSLDRTPWDQKGYDYWACSPVLSYSSVKGHRIDAVFEMHERKHWNSKEIKDMLYTFIAVNAKSIIYMQDKCKEIKNSEKYPLSEIQEKVNHDLLGKYFTSSIGFMVAMAVTSGQYNRIELWGCAMQAVEEEYSKQRAGVEAWLNYGLGLGVDYWIAEGSEVMKSNYIYGYEQRKDVLIKLMNIQEAVIAGVANYDAELHKARDNYNHQKGARTIMERIIREFK